MGAGCVLYVRREAALDDKTIGKSLANSTRIDAKRRLLLRRTNPSELLGWSGRPGRLLVVETNPFASVEWVHWDRLTGEEGPVEIPAENLSLDLETDVIVLVWASGSEALGYGHCQYGRWLRRLAYGDFEWRIDEGEPEPWESTHPWSGAGDEASGPGRAIEVAHVIANHWRLPGWGDKA